MDSELKDRLNRLDTRIDRIDSKLSEIFRFLCEIEGSLLAGKQKSSVIEESKIGT